MYFLRSMTFFRKYLSAQKRNALLWCFSRLLPQRPIFRRQIKRNQSLCLCFFAMFAADM